MDDVAYLKKNSKEESFLFVVDSSMRDKYAYPDSNSFSISFNAPFRNVFGLDLLNATVPRTEYAIEAPDNVLEYTVDGGPTRRLTIAPGDYNLVQVCVELNDAFLDGMGVEPHSTPYQIRSRSRFYCGAPFTLFATDPTILRKLGFNGTALTYTATLTGHTSQVVFYGPFAGVETLALTSSVIVRQAFAPSSTGTVSRVTVYAAESSSVVTMRIVDAGGTVYAADTLDPSQTSDMPIVGGGVIEAGTTYYIELTSASAEIYVNVPRDSGTAFETSPTAGPRTWTASTSGASVCAEVSVDVARYEIESPGLVDLTGERHVLVRSPEIESLVFRDRAYEPFHSGLGMVRLGVNGYQDQRTEFVSFPNRTMNTPIAKLSTLSFKLEKPNGKVYDLKGLEFTMVLALRYYTIHAREEHDASVLNPTYVPQFHVWQAQQWKTEEEARDARIFRQ